ncbi:UvrD-helicase domain-containing protein [Fluviispira sanaruensis]|uniref:DNA 3'-5' helicase n=1 Tax=Fluviispira sanaruensis TaxID=2493639 RepID=A0A4P2VXV7_FLUSA|nr:UvrD-helicase domain-containing protein [Fluviispira sanaruensis]BBH53872.1 DNA helicase UvrD [Fluviispira sanaruensis]
MSLANEKEPIKIAERVNEEFQVLAPKLELDTPWHAYVSFKNKKEDFEFRIGAVANKEEKIVDWRHPVAKFYYQKLNIGEEIELEPPFRSIQGAVTAFGAAEGYSGYLKSLEWSDLNGTAKIVRLDDGSFVDLNNTQSKEENEKTTQVLKQSQQEGLPDLISLLTPEQYELITQKTSEPLIIQGRAGSGKTSVALHRVSWLLWDENEEHGINKKTKVLVVMFNKSLQSFVKQSIKSLNLEDKIEINTFHSWAISALESVYKGQLETISGKNLKKLFDKYFFKDNEKLGMIKSHAGISQLMEVYVKAQAKKTWDFIEGKIPAYDTDNIRFKFKRSETAYVQDIIEFRQEIKRLILKEEDEYEKKRLEQIEILLQNVYEKSILYKEELLSLLSHWEWLMKCIPGLTEEKAKKIGQRQKIIQSEGKASSAKVGKYVEYDDYALLLRLVQLKRGGLPYGLLGENIFKFDHLVIDEAQDFGAMQLLVLLESVNSRTGVTIVGDTNQKIFPEKEFIGWDEIAKQLNFGNAKVTRLEVGHRSTLPIMWLADSVIGSEKILQGRQGAYPQIISVQSYFKLKEQITHFILKRIEEAPHAHICVVLHDKQMIEALKNDLQSLLKFKKIEVRQSERESFEFRKGVTVTNIHQIKGLEFDSIIIADANNKYWPDDIDNRRLMYVAITRAQENFLALYEGQPTPLLEVLNEKEFWRPVERFFTQKEFKPVEIIAEELDEALTVFDLEF